MVVFILFMWESIVFFFIVLLWVFVVDLMLVDGRWVFDWVLICVFEWVY